MATPAGHAAALPAAGVGGELVCSGNLSMRPWSKASCSDAKPLLLSQLSKAWLRSSRKGFVEFGLWAMNSGVKPLTLGVSSPARNSGSPGGLSALGYVAK